MRVRVEDLSILRRHPLRAPEAFCISRQVVNSFGFETAVAEPVDRSGVSQNSSKANIRMGLIALFYAAVKRWLAQEPGVLGAALAYYTVFSIGPLLIIMVAIAGLVLERTEAQVAVTEYIEQSAGAGAATMVQQMLSAAISTGAGIGGIITGVATLLITALGAVLHLRYALNRILEAEPVKASGVFAVVRRYAMAVGGVLGAGLLLIAAVAASTLISSFSEQLSAFIPPPWLALLNTLISLGLTAAVFAAMFKWLSDAVLAWSDALSGGIVTALLFELGKLGISWYLSRQAFGSTYGASASLAVLLAWIYYTSQILFFGAAFSYACAMRRAR